MSLIKHDKFFKNLNRDEFLTPFDKVFDEFFKSSSPYFSNDFGVDFFKQGAYPRVNVTEYADKIVLEATVAGLSKEDVSVEVEKGLLTISTKNTNSTNVSNESALSTYTEIRKSSSRRSFVLSENIDIDNVNAEVKNGLLTVTLKKIVPVKPEKRTINIT